MSYFRLRDIKTPPFAYVLNRDSVVQFCPQCQMPMRDMKEALSIEVCANSSDLCDVHGKPLMADYWLVGDAQFADRLQTAAPGAFERQPVGDAIWTHTGCEGGGGLPDFFLLRPRTGIRLDARLREQFPAMDCFGCGRDIPDLPFNCQPFPEQSANGPAAAFLVDLYLEGYDYLFHERLAGIIADHFPQMILEKIVADPVLP